MYCDFPVLGRCCFCMPLRRGILTFGYINLVVSAISVGLFSYAVHHGDPKMVIYHGSNASLSSGICIALHCFDFVFNAILLYGAHKVLNLPIKVYYYYSISTIFASLLIQIIDFISETYRPYFYPMMLIEGLPLLIVSMFLEIYLIILVRSLLRKMEQSGPHNYENQLTGVVFDGKMAPNGVYNNPTVLRSPHDEVGEKEHNSSLATHEIY